jgi:exosortase
VSPDGDSRPPARHDASRMAALVIPAVSAALLVYAPVLGKLILDWWSVPDSSHGLICGPAAAVLAWNRRDQLRQTPVAARSVALLGLAAAMLLLLLGTLGAELFLTRISFVLFLASTVVFVAGWRHLRILAFPFALLLVAIPIPAIVMTRITLPLQFAASHMAEMGLTSAGIPVLREGNVLILPNAVLQVAEACSGIRSLMALLTMALVMARFADPRWLARGVIILAAVPVAIAINSIRVTLTAAGTYWYGPVLLEGLVHETLGWLMFVLALGLLGACARGIARNPAPLTIEASP